MTKGLALTFSTLLWVVSYPVAFNSPNLVPEMLSSTLIWFAFVPMAIALNNASPRSTFQWTYCFGLLSNFGILFWIIIAIQKYGGLSFLISFGILLSLIATLALYPALSFWAAASLKHRAPPWLVASTLFTLLEWTRVYFPLEGFSWATPAYGLYSATLLLQASDIVGTCGLNFVLLSGNFLIAQSFICRKNRIAYPKIGWSIFLLLFGGFSLYGIFRIPQVETAYRETPTLQVALLQGNVPQDQKMDATNRKRVLLEYQHLVASANEQGADLIVWPEAALPTTVPADIQTLRYALPESNSVPNVIGAPTWMEEKGKRVFYNSAFVVDDRGNVISRYDKQHLVPFGEYVPLVDYLPMQKIVPAVAGNFKAAAQATLGKLNSHPFGILICYESLFPDLSIERIRKNATFLANITNDAWFDHTSGPFQHLRFGRFRAIETRRFLVRAANTGVSGWFDPVGSLHQPTELFTRAVVMAKVHPLSELTFYAAHPRLVPLLLSITLLFCGVGLFSAGIKRSASAPGSSSPS